MKEKILEKLYKNHSKISQENIFYITNAKQLVSETGNPNAPVLIIGEAPGAEEEVSGIPFCGRSGKLLRHYLNKYNINETNSFITNVVKFRPPGNRKPTKKEIEVHKIILNQEIAVIKPKIIVTVGSVATTCITENNTPISKKRGTEIIKNNCIIFPLFHPAYLLRNRNLIPVFEEDILKLSEIINSLSSPSKITFY